MKKNRYLYIIVIILLMISKTIYASNSIDTEDVLSTQKEEFGIRDFLKETKEYAPDFINELNISDLFSEALTGNVDNSSILKKFFNAISSQLGDTLKILINILIIVLIHSLLKSVTDSLENNNVSKIVYYAQYILIVTIVMSNFSNILNSINDTIERLVGFSWTLIPLLITLMAFTGNVTTTTIVEPILLFLIEFIANIIKNLIVPIISIITVLILISGITDKVQINKLSNFMKSSIVWALGIIITVFIGVLSLEGTLTSSVDGITAKTAKATISNLIPVVRKSFRRWC